MTNIPNFLQFNNPFPGLEVSSNKLFFPWALKFIEDYRKRKEITQRFTSGLKLAERCSDITYFCDLTPLNISNYNNRLLNIYGQSYINSVHYHLRTCVNQAVLEGKIKENPYLGLKLRRNRIKTVHRDIGIDDVIKIITADYSKPLVVFAAHLISVSFLTGFGYKELMCLKYDNLKEFQDLMWFSGFRQKTDIPFIVPVFDEVDRVIEIYKTKTTLSRGLKKETPDHLFPFICYSYYNTLLKQVAQEAGVKALSLSTYVGRHTCATLLSDESVSTESISRILGHTNVKMTGVYTHITMRKIISELKNVRIFKQIKANNL